MTSTVVILIIIGIICIIASVYVVAKNEKNEIPEEEKPDPRDLVAEPFVADLTEKNKKKLQKVVDSYVDEFTKQKKPSVEQMVDNTIKARVDERANELDNSLSGIDEKILQLDEYFLNINQDINRNKDEVNAAYSLVCEKQKEIKRSLAILDEYKQGLDRELANRNASYENTVSEADEAYDEASQDEKIKAAFIPENQAYEENVEEDNVSPVDNVKESTEVSDNVSEADETFDASYAEAETTILTADMNQPEDTINSEEEAPSKNQAKSKKKNKRKKNRNKNLEKTREKEEVNTDSATEVTVEDVVDESAVEDGLEGVEGVIEEVIDNNTSTNTESIIEDIYTEHDKNTSEEAFDEDELFADNYDDYEDDSDANGLTIELKKPEVNPADYSDSAFAPDTEDQVDNSLDAMLEGEDVSLAGSVDENVMGMYWNGFSILEIAKKLGLGVGEVKSIVDNHRENN